MTFVIVVVVVAVLLFGGALALASVRKARTQAGLPGGVEVPKAWSGEHSTEARMHRRLLAAHRALAAVPLGDPAQIERKVAVEQRIRALDEALLAASRRPDKADVLATLEKELVTVESDVAAACSQH
ncbi:hypothetical protein [Actinokineospora pegani]|uniref:hypothetical protein n=1 Tax=Actinokineospora pegani TaxID=2654637 RepID=UPI0012EA8118|nr:hypothetical protein [Actinokineospora pegani]